ncbi:MAG: hypothetical protein WCL21_18250 [Mariniphaga sp.]
MAFINIELVTGEKFSYELTPATEYAFEEKFNEGFYKRFREKEKQSDAYWLAWESQRDAAAKGTGSAVKPFGGEYIATLKAVTIDFEATLPNG